MRSMLLLVLIICCSCAYPSVGQPTDQQYGEIARFSKGRELQYPDFSVRYLEKRREITESYPRGFVYYDFEVATQDESMTVSWTPGTGAIAPELFSVGGDEYFLVLKINELKREDYMLADDELIVWPQELYLEKLAESR